MAKKVKWYFIAILLIITIIAIVPPLRYGYIYPTAGDDTAWHLIYFQNMDAKTPLYYGQYLVGEMVNTLPFDPNTTFFWFHYAVFILALWSIGLSVSLSFNYLSGIMSVLLVFGLSQFINMFEWGLIFDLVGIAILLPLLLLCLHKMNNAILWRVGMLISLVLFAVFHANGKYLIALIPIVVVYELVIVIASRKYINLKQKLRNNRFVFYALGLASILTILFLVKYSPDPLRLWMDATIIFTMAVGVIIGKYIGSKISLTSIVAIILIGMLVMPNMSYWMRNNSAVKSVDKEAIEYLNKLEGNTYVVSSQVTKNIYNLYVTKQWVDDMSADYVVVRTKPMTLGSTSDSRYFENKDRVGMENKLDDYEYRLLKIYDDKEVQVLIYGKVG